MNKTTLITLIIILVLFFSGCASTNTALISKPETVVVNTPAFLLQSCSVATPPDKTKYMLEDMSGREGLLTDYISSLLLNLSNCNTQINSIKTFQNKQDLLYAK